MSRHLYENSSTYKAHKWANRGVNLIIFFGVAWIAMTLVGIHKAETKWNQRKVEYRQQCEAKGGVFQETVARRRVDRGKVECLTPGTLVLPTISQEF